MSSGQTPPGVPVGSGAEDAPTSLFGGRYRIERVIGQGAFGRVYLAFDTRLRRNVAIKELLATRNRTDADTYARYLERFQREARAAGVVQHPNIVAVHELAIDADENHYLIMEYIDGTDLRDLLAQVGTLPVERSVAIAIEVARALEAVHEQDIVHRDLKPANIMLTRRGVAKLTDFGIAQVGNESHRTQVASGHPGTLIYMSPEQGSGYGYLDGRSDLYALGLVLYEMLAGEPYVRKRRPLATVRPDAPPALAAIVERLMAKEADDRYQHAGEVVEALQSLSSARPSLATAEPAAYPFPVDDRTRVGGPGSQGSQSPPPPFGVPPVYGGATTGSQPGAPVYTGVTPPPIGGAAPPYAPPFSAPPPSAGPRKRRSGLWLGIGGGVVALVAILAIIDVVAGGGGGKSTPAVNTAVVSSPAGSTAVVASPIPANAYVVADAKNLITYAYPTEWKAGGVTTFDVDIVAGYTNFNPYGIVSVAKEDVTASTTLDGYTDDYIARRFRKSPDWKPGPISKRNAKIAGQDARVIDFLQPSTSDGGIAPKGATIYQYITVTIRDNRAWTIGYAVAMDQKETFQKQYEVLTNTFGFCPTSGCTRTQTVPTVAPGQTTKWVDPAKLLTAEYPADWFAYPEDKAQGATLYLSSPDGVFFSIYTVDQQGATLDQEVQALLDFHDKNTETRFTDLPATDTTVGGEPARAISYTFAPKSDPAAKPRNGAAWIVNRGGKEFLFEGDDLRARRADIEKIVGSVVFTGPAAVPTARPTTAPTATPVPQPTPTAAPTTAPTATTPAAIVWTDPNGVLSFRYPGSWNVGKEPNSTSSAVTVSSGSISIRVYIYDPGKETLDQNFQRIRDHDSDDGTTVRVYDPVLDTKVGGQPAKSMAYKYMPKDQPNAAPGIGTIWLVDHNGKRYEFFCSNLATNRQAIEAVINSVTFLK